MGGRTGEGFDLGDTRHHSLPLCCSWKHNFVILFAANFSCRIPHSSEIPKSNETYVDKVTYNVKNINNNLATICKTERKDRKWKVSKCCRRDGGQGVGGCRVRWGISAIVALWQEVEDSRSRYTYPPSRLLTSLLKKEKQNKKMYRTKSIWTVSGIF